MTGSTSQQTEYVSEHPAREGERLDLADVLVLQDAVGYYREA